MGYGLGLTQTGNLWWGKKKPTKLLVVIWDKTWGYSSLGHKSLTEGGALPQVHNSHQYTCSSRHLPGFKGTWVPGGLRTSEKQSWFPTAFQGQGDRDKPGSQSKSPGLRKKTNYSFSETMKSAPKLKPGSIPDWIEVLSHSPICLTEKRENRF